MNNHPARFILFITSFQFIFGVATLAQSISRFRGTAGEQARISFREIVEYNNLYPALKTRGIQVCNTFEKYPEITVDPNRVVYRAPAGSFVPARQVMEPSPEPEIDFQGLDDSGGSIPPDVNGAVGPNHLMVTLNTDFRILDKQGNILHTVGSGAFWHPFPGSAGVFDPKILYDHFEHRWVLIQPSSSDPSTSRLMVACSENDDPTGNWFLYSFDGDPEDIYWFDYPDWGFNKKWIVATGNMIFQSVPHHAAVYVISKADLYNFAPVVSFTRIEVFDGFSLIPAVSFDETEEDVYLVNHAGGNVNGYGYLHLRKVTGALNDPQIEDIGLSGVPYPWNEWGYFEYGDFAPQLGSDERINTVDARFENMVQRNGKLWTVHHVYLPADEPTRSSMQWWNLATDGTILQWGRDDDETGNHFCAFASIAVNAKEDVMIGYGSFSYQQYASGCYSFRYAGDPPNELRERHVFVEGLAPYYKTFGGGRNRWGDYTATTVDPVNDLDFWTLQEYAELPSSQDHWGVWWAKVNVDAIPAADFTAYITEVPVGSTVSFHDLSKYEPTAWKWIFEGASPGTSTDQNPKNITYPAAGFFDVTLIASNFLGSDTMIMTDYINANTTILPSVDFTVTDTIPCLGDTVVFTDLTLYNPNEWQWEFSPNLVTFVNNTGPGSQHPAVVFLYPFSYTVTLLATNNNGSVSVEREGLIKAGGLTLPYVQDFETLSFSRIGWTVENPDNSKTWKLTPVQGNEPGNFAASVNIKSYNAFGQRDRLISPPLNFYAFKNMVLEFQYAYAQRYPQYTDSLIVYISADCGATWSRLLALGEDGNGTFVTHEPSTLDFIPETSADWCGADGNPECPVVDLSEWAGQSNVRFMFESYNGFGNNLYLDNIRLTGDVNAVDPIGQEYEKIQVYPNPATSKIFLSESGEAMGMNYSLCDLAGRNMILGRLINSGGIHTIGVEKLTPGIYLLKLEVDGRTITRKVIIR